MKADIKWLDNPEVFRINQIAAHSDHDYYLSYEDAKSENKKSSLFSWLDWGQNDRSVAAGLNAPWGYACRISQRI